VIDKTCSHFSFAGLQTDFVCWTIVRICSWLCGRPVFSGHYHHPRSVRRERIVVANCFCYSPARGFADQKYRYLEALIPVNSHTGHNIGFIGQLHFYLDDIFPRLFRKPLFGS
jgi:hypothetical protein